MTIKIKRAFNHAANTYDAHCHLQQSIGDNLLNLIKPYHFTQPRMMDLGCGTGIVTEKLAALFSHQDFHAIDFADHLLKKAYARLLHTGIKIYNADFEKLPAYTQPFDIIFSNMALHWSSHLQKTLKSIISLLNAGGVLAFTIPLSGTLNELQPYFAINPFAENTVIINELMQNKCNILINHLETITLHFDDTVSALKSIKNVGANTVKQRLSTCMHGKSFIKQMRLRELTYHIGYFIARKMEATCQLNYLLPEQTPILEKRTSVSVY